MTLTNDALQAYVRPGAIHRDVYKDASVFDLEMERIFKGTWVYIGHDSELPEPGDYRTMAVGREPVIFARDRNGELNVMVNRCRHRAASVCQRASGNANSFRCHYHGWTYRNDGTLTGVPKRDRYDTDIRPGLGLVKLPRVDAYRGLVFASFNPDVLPLHDHLGAAARAYVDQWLDVVGNRRLAALDQAHRMVYGSNWKLQVENGLDGYHATFTHASFFDLMQGRTGANVRFASSFKAAETKSFGNGHTVVDPQTADRSPLLRRVEASPNAEMLLAALRNRVDPVEYEELRDAVAGTGINVGIYPNLQLIGTQLRRIEPVSVNSTIVVVRPLILRDGPEEFNELRLRYHELFYGPAGFGQPDDVEMFLRVGMGLNDDVDEWLLLDRGLTREVDDEGVRTGHVSDETPQRAQYRQWLHLMTTVPASARDGEGQVNA